MWLTSPLEWGAIINGAGTDEKTSIYVATPEDAHRWADLFGRSVLAGKLLPSTDSASEFFRIESDLAHLIPQREHAEAFYSMKLGYCVPGVPAEFIYFAQKVYQQYKICNLVCPLLPKHTATMAKRKSYLSSGYTLRDVLCSFVNPNFTALTEEKQVVRCGDWYELWLPQCDMVAAVPIAVGEKLHNEDVARICLTDKGLMLDQVPLSALGGVADGGYDLR